MPKKITNSNKNHNKNHIHIEIHNEKKVKRNRRHNSGGRSKGGGYGAIYPAAVQGGSIMQPTNKPDYYYPEQMRIPLRGADPFRFTSQNPVTEVASVSSQTPMNEPIRVSRPIARREKEDIETFKELYDQTPVSDLKGANKQQPETDQREFLYRGINPLSRRPVNELREYWEDVASPQTTRTPQTTNNRVIGQQIRRVRERRETGEREEMGKHDKPAPKGI